MRYFETRKVNIKKNKILYDNGFIDIVDLNINNSKYPKYAFTVFWKSPKYNNTGIVASIISTNPEIKYSNFKFDNKDKSFYFVQQGRVKVFPNDKITFKTSDFNSKKYPWKNFIDRYKIYFLNRKEYEKFKKLMIEDLERVNLLYKEQN